MHSAFALFGIVELFCNARLQLKTLHSFFWVLSSYAVLKEFLAVRFS